MDFSMSETNLLHGNPLEKLRRGLDASIPAIVLRARPFRDSDLMAHLLTPSLGKISAIARHARGSKKRFPSSLDLFDRGIARLTREKSGALSVKEFTPSHSLIKVRSDLDKLTLASLLCETFDLIVQENTGEDSSKLFEILDLALNAIDEATELRTSLRASLVALISVAKMEGIIDLTSSAPGSRALSTVLDAIERFSEKKLLTRSSLDPLLSRIAAAA
jgi:recombinational DNA repair protein (RecF pathway)